MKAPLLFRPEGKMSIRASERNGKFPSFLSAKNKASLTIMKNSSQIMLIKKMPCQNVINLIFLHWTPEKKNFYVIINGQKYILYFLELWCLDFRLKNIFENKIFQFLTPNCAELDLFAGVFSKFSMTNKTTSFTKNC